MASPLTKRALTRIADDGFAKAKKSADLSIKINVDGKGSSTARGYEDAISILQPYVSSGKEKDALDAQRLIASYQNSLTKLNKTERDQNETVSAFKLQEHDAYFTSFDADVGGFRNPASLVGATSESLDGLVLGVLNAIEEKEANNESTDALHSYLNELVKRSDTMRDLRQRFENGELGDGQSLDGFGYYVDTNPLDGSIRGAAFLPVGLAPNELTNGYRRLDATTKVGGALLPVYAPTQRDAIGDYVARVGDATWSGTGEGALRAKDAKTSKNLFTPGGFDIADAAKFPVRTSKIDKGQFGVGLIGRDAEGNVVEGTFYRGADGKLYSVDSTTLEQFKKDPILNQKLSGYVSRFSPSEAQGLIREAQPFSQDRIGRESRIASFATSAAESKAESDRMSNMGFFEQVADGFKTNNPAPAPAPVTAPQTSFFGARNNPDKPDEEPSIAGSAPDIIEKGKELFRSAAGFFSGRAQ